MKRLFFLLPMIFLLSACGNIEWNRDLAQTLSEDTCTPYFFFAHESDGASYVRLEYAVGATMLASELPDSSWEAFSRLNPGYKIDGWKWFRHTVPDTGTDSSVTPASFNTDAKTKRIKSVQITTVSECLSVLSWTPITYTIAFNANGGSGIMPSLSTCATTDSSELAPLTYETAVTLPANTFTRDGYLFAGWSDPANRTTYSDGAEVSRLTTVEGATVTLYARWEVAP